MVKVTSNCVTAVDKNTENNDKTRDVWIDHNIIMWYDNYHNKELTPGKFKFYWGDAL